MLVVRTLDEIRHAVAEAKASGHRVGFVPTMGALHAGHVSLIEAARRDCDWIAVSIFVNPTQFAPGEDFQRYPRPLEQDLSYCTGHDVACAFVPSVEEMFSDDRLTTVHVEKLGDGLCGPFRPGHFDAVATVVAKLFHIVQPHAAYFGEKDYQQLRIIRRLVRDLNIPVTIVGCPTHREADGLAMSSRNAYLSVDARQQAAGLYAGLVAAVDAARRGVTAAAELTAIVRTRLEAAGPCAVEYISLVDSESLELLEKLDRPARLCAAIRIAETRLIDNVAVDPTL